MYRSERQTSHGNPHRSAKTCVWHLSSWGASHCLTLHWPMVGGQRSLWSWVWYPVPLQNRQNAEVSNEQGCQLPT